MTHDEHLFLKLVMALYKESNICFNLYDKLLFWAAFVLREVSKVVQKRKVFSYGNFKRGS